jgi:DNA topoisomerase-1
VLGIPSDEACRVTFNEITKAAVKKAVKQPRKIDYALVKSQQARRILDRIVGYQLSPFLWKHIKSGLSAGRVQSVAARIVCEREEEIRSFIPQEYWKLGVTLTTNSGEEIVAHFAGEKPHNEEEARRIEDAIRQNAFRVLSIKKQLKHRQSMPPFITSTLQQEASKKLGLQPQQVMAVAQELYEGINLGAENGGVQGLITYMRTDSLRVSEEAQNSAREYIIRTFGEQYYPSIPNIYKTKTGAQDAHEAIRPSNVKLTPEEIRGKLTPNQYRLYQLIWNRFLASQMAPAIYDTVTIDLDCSGYHFRAGGYTVSFLGYTILQGHEEPVGEEQYVETQLPNFVEGESLITKDVLCEQHFTEPPARYTDATLIKMLEESGIGRPSTYATIITTIIAREYVVRNGRSLAPTTLGETTTRLMKESFPEIIDYEFTAQMEDKLDSIEQGITTMEDIMSTFYRDFSVTLASAMEKTVHEEVPFEESSYTCEKCGSKMVYKNGRFGKYLACVQYPTCKSTIAVDENGEPLKRQETPAPAPRKIEMQCDLCGSDMVVRNGKFGEFYACSQYPNCRFTKQIARETGVACPKCGGKILIRRSRDKKVFYSCEGYPTCSFSTWDLPLAEKCPDCGGMLVYKKARKCIVCINKTCEYTRFEEIKVTE